LIVVAVMPALSLAQTAQVKPSPQQRSSTLAPSAAVAPAPAGSKRFVTNESFFRAGTTPQSASAGPQAASTPNAVARPNGVILIPRGAAIPQPVKPAVVAAVPELRTPPAAVTSTTAITAAHDASAAVDYASGQLTVVADKAPLGLVLKLIAGKTGAVVDVAPELQQEPVMARLGPAPVREVLTGLLDSPRIDYIVFGTGDEPGSLQRILVRRRQSFGDVAVGGIRQSRPAGGAPQSDPNGRVIYRETTPAQAEAMQEQRMEEWRKARAQMLEAEVKQQAQDRENERYQVPEQPAPQEVPQQQDNPPQL
jgi:hypothetical protein